MPRTSGLLWRLVIPVAVAILPLEDHGPVAKQTLLDLWARWGAWLEKYVKDPQKPAAKKSTTLEPVEVR